jgi:hypothetical protein
MKLRYCADTDSLYIDLAERPSADSPSPIVPAEWRRTTAPPARSVDCWLRRRPAG